MKEITKIFPNVLAYDLKKICSPEKTLFFDIETTGLSPKNSKLYLIGCIHINEENTMTFKQWFAESLSEEFLILQSFAGYAAKFNSLIHFNGDGFDLPYIRECSKQYYLFNPLETLQSIDIYKKIRYLKKPLGLSHVNQKSLEAYLGLNREDKYDGGTLIDFYYRYLDNKDAYLLKSLLLHNEEDILGMLKVMDMLSFIDFFNSDFMLSSREISNNNLILHFFSSECISHPLKLYNNISVDIKENHMDISVPVISTEMKFFFKDYKNYYYLTEEDYAVHKSIGEFVDKAFRKIATKETAYVKKHSDYIPCFACETAGIFKAEYKSKDNYIDIASLDFEDGTFFNSYAKGILKYFKLIK